MRRRGKVKQPTERVVNPPAPAGVSAAARTGVPNLGAPGAHAADLPVRERPVTPSTTRVEIFRSATVRVTRPTRVGPIGVVIVDPDPTSQAVLRREVEARGCRCALATSLDQARGQPDFEVLILSADIVYSDPQAIERFGSLKHSHRLSLYTLVLVPPRSRTLAEAFLTQGANARLPKPWQPAQLQVELQNALDVVQAQGLRWGPDVLFPLPGRTATQPTVALVWEWFLRLQTRPDLMLQYEAQWRFPLPADEQQEVRKPEDER
jgi:CheY-like chemotaxis protein